MPYKYTEEGCFKGELLKEPPLPLEDARVKKMYDNYSQYIKRRWFHTGCAMEELGRFGSFSGRSDVNESALVWWLKELLGEPAPIDNNDGVHAARTVNGVKQFDARFVIATLVDYQIKSGLGDILEEYFGFKRLAPYFGNVEKYGNNSRIGVYGLCCTRYIVDEENKDAS